MQQVDQKKEDISSIKHYLKMVLFRDIKIKIVKNYSMW